VKRAWPRTLLGVAGGAAATEQKGDVIFRSMLVHFPGMHISHLLAALVCPSGPLASAPQRCASCPIYALCTRAARSLLFVSLFNCVIFPLMAIIFVAQRSRCSFLRHSIREADLLVWSRGRFFYEQQQRSLFL
jgi:hypothetical protein